jgi:CRISPR/Cas system-associated protein Cas10 (large subunit of type III CRISPR-Cas system)
MYTPKFTCEHCGRELAVEVGPACGSITLCQCGDASVAYEQQHRAEMERRRSYKRKVNIRESRRGKGRRRSDKKD